MIRGTDFEGHVMTVGGCVRDDLMGLEIKDIDMCVSLPDGGIRFVEWLKEALEYSPKKYKIDLNVTFDDLGEYTEEELKFIFQKNISIYQ